MDGTASLDLELKDSYPSQAAADDEEDAVAPTFHTNTLATKVAVKPGHAVAAQAVDEKEADGGVTSLVIVTARVLGAEGDKE